MPFPDGYLQLESLNGPDSAMTADEAKQWQKFKRVVRDFSWVSPDGRTAVTVAAGRFIDGASVPGFLGILWWLVGSPFGPLDMSGAIHDELYRDGSDRGVADYIFGAVAKETPAVKRYKRIIAVIGLRAGGWWTWRKYRGQFPFKRSRSQ